MKAATRVKKCRRARNAGGSAPVYVLAPWWQNQPVRVKIKDGRESGDEGSVCSNYRSRESRGLQLSSGIGGGAGEGKYLHPFVPDRSHEGGERSDIDLLHEERIGVPEHVGQQLSGTDHLWIFLHADSPRSDMRKPSIHSGDPYGFGVHAGAARSDYTKSRGGVLMLTIACLRLPATRISGTMVRREGRLLRIKEK